MSTTTVDALIDTAIADEAAEKAVLGAMLNSASAIADVVEIVRTPDFYQPRHGVVFAAIMRAFGAGEPADPVTIAAALDGSGELSRIGGAPYLHTLMSDTPSPGSAAWYARRVADMAVRRRVAEAGVAITAAARRDDSPELPAKAEQMLLDATDRGDAGRLASIADLLDPALQAIEAVGSRGGGLTGLATGLLDLDRLTSGLQPGQLVVVAGRPGMGKSVLGLNTVRHCALRLGRPVLFASLEMAEQEIVNRILAAETRVPLNVLNSGSLTEADWTTIGRSAGQIAEAPMWIDATARTSVLDIRAKARRLKARLGDLGLVVVDYVQLLTPVTKADTREREVAEMSRGLKLLAKDLDCPVIAVAQLNRGVEQRTDKRPLLSDLRESGALEADADIVMLLYRDDYYDRESPRAGEVDIDVAKHRAGPTDTITAAAQLHLARIADMAMPTE